MSSSYEKSEHYKQTRKLTLRQLGINPTWVVTVPLVSGGLFWMGATVANAKPWQRRALTWFGGVFGSTLTCYIVMHHLWALSQRRILPPMSDRELGVFFAQHLWPELRDELSFTKKK